jgi:hypothetical protein
LTFCLGFINVFTLFLQLMGVRRDYHHLRDRRVGKMIGTRDRAGSSNSWLQSDNERHDMPEDWVRGLRTYPLVIAFGNLIWETLHLPLYTIWNTGTLREKLFAVVHCTGGDVLIALASLALALVIGADRTWPKRGWKRVVLLTVCFGVGYTIFSEWLNIVVRASWAYSELMPVIPVVGIGLSPLLEWVVVPLLAFNLARRSASARSGKVGTEIPGL